MSTKKISVEDVLKARLSSEKTEKEIDDSISKGFNSWVERYNSSLIGEPKATDLSALTRDGQRYFDYFKENGNTEGTFQLQTVLDSLRQQEKSTFNFEKNFKTISTDYDTYLPNSEYVKKYAEESKTDYIANMNLLDTTGAAGAATYMPMPNGKSTLPSIEDYAEEFKVKDEWKLEWKKKFLELYQSDPEQAVKFAGEANRALKLGEAEEFGRQHWFLGGLASIPLNLVGAIDFGRNALEYVGGKVADKDVELERSYATDMSNAIRKGGAESEDIKWEIDIGEEKYNLGGFLYNVGLSVADMAVASYAGGGINAITSKIASKLGSSVGGKILGKALTSIGSGAVLGLSAASSTTNDVLDRGGTDAQALTSGLVAGIFETLFESLSIGELKSMGRTSKEAFKTMIKKAGKENVKTLFKRLGVDALKSMGANATEEAATELANILYDSFVNGDVSNYAIMVENYMKEDPTLTKNEAREKAIERFTGQVLESAASGAIMGLFLGNGATVKAYMDAKSSVAAEDAAIAKQTNAISKPLSSYPVEKQTSIRSFIGGVDEKIKSFVNNVKNGDLTFKRQKISDVSDRAAGDIKNLLDIDVSGYTHNINTNGVQHIINRHGANGQQDSSMAIDDDIARIGWVLDNYDNVELLGENGVVHSSAFMDRNNQPAPQIRFVKKIDGTYYVVEAAFDNDYKKLWVQSAYLEKNKEDVTQASADGNATDHEANAQSALASPSSDSTVTQRIQSVKNNISNQSGNNASFLNLSAANPKNDIVGDAIAKSSGVPNRTDDQRLLRKIGKAFDVNVDFADLDEMRIDDNGKEFLFSPEGKYNKKTNTIILNTNVKDYHRPVQFIVKHELTHSLEKNQGLYNDFANSVMDSQEFKNYIKTKGFTSAQEWNADIRKRYSEQNAEGFSGNNAELLANQEMVADFVGDMLFGGQEITLERLLMKLTPEERNGFVEWIEQIFAKLRQVFTGREALNEIEILEKKFLKTARKVAMLNETGQQKNTTENGNGGKYSMAKTFDQQVDDVLNGKHNPRYDLYVSETPKIFKDLGFSESPLLMRNSKVNEILKKHSEMSIDTIKKIPEAIKTPLLILKSKTNPMESVVVITDIKTSKGEMIIPVWVNQDGNYLDLDLQSEFSDKTNFVASAYGRNIKALIEYANDNEGFLYQSEDIEKVRQLLARNGLQLPTPLKLSDSDITVPQKEQSVNSNSMQEYEEYSIAGPKSHTANLENLEKAKERDQRLKDTKANSENTRRKYGWFRGLDRMWRYEISDKEAEVDLLNPEYKRLSEELNRLSAELGPPYDAATMDKMDEIVNAMTKVSRYRNVKVLGEILKHDKLFAAYPELRNYKVKFVELKDGSAEFDPATKTIKINKNTVKTIDIATIMHEVQHAIQDIEGFASGSSQEYWESIEKKHNEKLKEISDVFKEIEAKGGANLVNLAHRYLDISAKVFENDANSEQLQREREGIDAQAKLKGSYRLLQKLLMLDIETRALEKKLEFFDSDYDRYYNTAGEIEARNVEERLHMTDEEREASRPDIDRKKVAFVEGKFRAADEGNIDEVAKEKGYSQKLYHQTGKDFNVFDTEHQKAGKYDPEMPTGTFLKPTDADIGLEGNKQMELYTKIKNPLQFKDRADAVRFWKRNVEGYAEAVRNIDGINTEYREKSFLAQEDVQSYLKEWRENNPTASRREIYKDSEYQRLADIEQDVLGEWENASNVASLEAKKLIDAYMRDSGYDGVVVENDQGSRGRTVKTYIVFDSSQMKSTDAVTYDDNGNEIPLSARFDSSKKDIRYSIPNAETNKYKVMNPVEIANLKPEDALVTPKLEQKERSIPEGKLKTSKFFESSIDSPLITPSLKIDISNNEFIKTYRSITNRETLNKAQARLQEQGSQAVIDFKNLKEDEAAPVDIAMGFILLVEYQRVGDLESAAVVAEKLRSFGTAAGQAVQLYSILQRFTPDMMQMYAQKELDKAFEILRKKKFQKWADANRESFKLTDEDVEFIRRRTLQAALVEDNSRIKAVLIGEIQARIQSKLPSNAGDSIRSLQRSAMLLNLRTFIRNVWGNVSSATIYIPSDFFGSIIDKAIAKKTGQRVRGNVRLGDTDIYKAFGKGVYESWDDFKRDIHTRREAMDRYEINTSRGKSFNENMTGKLAKLNGIAHVLNKIDNFTSFTLEVGDRPFFEMWMTNSLNNLMKLNSVPEATPEMVEIAFQEALQRTWQDDNKFTNAVSGVKRFLNAIPFRVPGTDYGLGDWAIKFVKTPSNIAKAIVEVSPVGFALVPPKVLEYQKALSRGELTLKEQKDFVDSLSKAITGTLIYTMVAMLAGVGAIELSGGGDDDKDAANFEKYIVGVHPYSIKIFGKWISYEWNQPIGAVLATVADFMENKKSNPDSALEDDLLNAFKGGMSVFANQSFLKSVSELFSGKGWVEGILNSILSEPAAFIPQVSSQFASFFDEYRRTTYDPTSEWQSAINNLIYKIPFLRETLPTQINVLGEKVENIQYLNPWEAFATPGNRYPESSGKVAEEIYQLYKDTGDVTVMPRTAPTNIKVGGQKFVFTAQGRNNIQQVMGGISSDILSFVFDSDEYDQLDETQKVKVVSNVYSYAYAIAKSKLDLDYNALSNLIGEDNKGNPILSEETYNKLTPEAREMLAREDFLSKDEEKCKQDPQKLAKLFIDKAKK